MNVTAPSNQDDVVDSRDIIERIEELESTETEPGVDGLDDEEREELRTLRALAEEASQYAADWEYGETLVRDSYFVDYAKELAEDTAPTREIAELISFDGRGDYWPMTCCTIDWDRAARDLQNDYVSVEWAGETYWIRMS